MWARRALGRPAPPLTRHRCRYRGDSSFRDFDGGIPKLSATEPKEQRVKLFPKANSRGKWLPAGLGGAALVLGAAAAVPAAASTGGSPKPAQSPSGGWVASWAASPMAGSTSFSNQTVRNIIYTSVGGNSLRVQL